MGDYVISFCCDRFFSISIMQKCTINGVLFWHFLLLKAVAIHVFVPVLKYLNAL